MSMKEAKPELADRDAGSDPARLPPLWLQFGMSEDQVDSLEQAMAALDEVDDETWE